MTSGSHEPAEGATQSEEWETKESGSATIRQAPGPKKNRIAFQIEMQKRSLPTLKLRTGGQKAKREPLPASSWIKA